MIEFLVLIALLGLFGMQRRMTQRLNFLEKQVSDLKSRLVSQAAATTPVAEAVSEVETEGEAFSEPEEAPIPDEEEPNQEPLTPKPPEVRESFESRLGAQWAVWVGGLALALGGIFLVRYSIDAGLLGPKARLTLAAVFGLVLALCGELLRRGALPRLPKAYDNAMIPGILTAAASITLMAVVYTAFAFYGFIGPFAAFVLLSLVALATLALSLLHGQALAGLGLVASLLTPLLVPSEKPNFNLLFGYLALVWLAANLAARIRHWQALPALANILMMFWITGLFSANGLLDMEAGLTATGPGLALIVMIAASAFIWPGQRFEADIQPDTQPVSLWRGLRRLLSRRPKGILISLSLTVLISILAMIASDLPMSADPVLMFVAVTGCLAALGAGRRGAAMAALFASLTAIWGMALFALLDSTAITFVTAEAQGGGWFATLATQAVGGLVLGGIFTVCGIFSIRRFRAIDRDYSVLWAVLAGLVPLCLAATSFVNYGILGGDWLHAAAMVVTAAALLHTALHLTRRELLDAESADMTRDLLTLGAFGTLTLALHCVTQGLATTVGVAVLGFLFVLAGLKLNWRGLPWAMIAATVIVLVRIGWEPTIVGPQNLSTTPVLNALLPGYGIPALLLTISAWLLRQWPGRRTVEALQALAALMVLLTLAILTRHAMQGGVLNDAVPTLAEQSIYTLLLIGLSGVLMTLDFGQPSRALRYGSMLAGGLAVLNALSLHLGGLNPYFTGESVGNWPLINLLLPGYLLPALAYAGLAAYARGKRPQPYVLMLGTAAGLLGFAWATLSVRWAWQGEYIAYWKGFLAAETYTYSVVWLLIGVGLLALGSRFAARSLRLASGALVLVAVCKAFLIDMSNLEGILRALSFIGLGIVLIGIGLFYQRLLAKGHKAPTE